MSTDRDALAEALAEHVCECAGDGDGQHVPEQDMTCAWTLALVRTILTSPQFARLIAAAEQRGREDTADHGMCYVHGSKALDSLIAAAEARGAARVREAVETLVPVVHMDEEPPRTEYLLRRAVLAVLAAETPTESAEEAK